MKTTPTFPIVAVGLCCEKTLPHLAFGIANTCKKDPGSFGTNICT